MSIIGTDRADTYLSNHIDMVPATTSKHSTPRSDELAIKQNTVTLSSTLPPHKRNIASSLASTMYGNTNTGIRPAAIIGDHATGLSESALTMQLVTADAQISRLRQRQPDFQNVTANTLRSALNITFPTLHLPIDLDGIYVTTYVNEVIDLPGDDAVPERRPTSSLTLNQALQNTIRSGHAPQYNPQQTGFFYAAGNAVNNPAAVVSGLHATADVATFAAVLQRIADSSSTTYSKTCRDFWNQPDVTSNSGQTPKAQLISAYQQQRLAEAKLRVADNTLSTQGEQLLRRAYAAEDPATLRNSLGMFSISLHSDTAPTAIPMAGISVLTRSANETPDATAGPVLLTIPGQGLMEFSSSVEYQQKLQQWFDDREQRAILLRHVAQQDRDHAEASRNSVRYTSPFQYDIISTPLAADRIQSLLDRQDLDITDTFNTARRERRAPEALLNEVTDLWLASDLTVIQKTRQQLLIEQFLKNASTDDRTKWVQELKQYQLALQKTQSSGLPLMQQYLDPAFLHEYANTQIQQQLHDDLQLSLDPDDINIITSELVAHALPEPLPTTMSLQTTTRTLTELAIGNTIPLDTAHRNKVTARDKDGYNVAQLTHDYLTRMVRGLNIGQHYKEMLQVHLLDSAEGRERERQYAQFLAAQLQLDAREAKIRGDLTDEGRQWIHETLASKPIARNGQMVRARQLSIGGNPLSTILLFGTQAPVLARDAAQFQPISMAYDQRRIPPETPFANTGISKIILYTPDAPDGIRLREFRSRLEMRETFINNPLMRDYILQCVNLEGQEAVTNILKQNSPGIDISDSAIAGNFLHTAYRIQANQIIENADSRSISNAEVASQRQQDRINMALDVAGILLPAKFTVPISLGRAIHSMINVSDTHKSGNKAQTLIEFIGTIGHLGDALLDGVLASKKLHTGLRRSHKMMTTPATQHRPEGKSASTAVASSEGQSTNKVSAPVSQNRSPSPAPAGMSAVEIDGATFYYWQSSRNIVTYRDLFEPDPAHPGQLKSAGYGAPDAQNIWRKISLHGGGGAQSLLSGITDVTPNREVQRLIHRIAGPNDTIDYFSAEIANSVHRLVYSFQDNTFFDPSSRLAGRYIPKHNAMQPLNLSIRRVVRDADREASLKALGINLKLPLDFTPNGPTSAAPIPHVIHSVWVGGEIPETRRNSILASLENNATMAKSSPRPYEMKLYLSNRNASAYENNLSNIRSKAPTVQVVVLENTPFYQQFKQSKYFSQYMAAIDGNGGAATNYASAADVLRYRLLHHEGGLYIDCDDTLMAPPGSININTAPTGLALDEPVSNILLGMDIQYNTSIFGSQKHNPTLDAISEESYKRFSETRELYSNQRPRRFTEAQRRTKTRQQNIENERQLYAYMRKISYVTGPNVFNKVIDDKLPDMHQLREAIKLKEHTWNFRLPASMRTNITAWAETRLPLGQINIMGSAHTWDETRR